MYESQYVLKIVAIVTVALVAVVIFAIVVDGIFVVAVYVMVATNFAMAAAMQNFHTSVKES